MLNVIDLGLTDYTQGLTIQEEYREKRSKELISDTILVTEHISCFTMGRNRQWNNLAISSDMLKREGISVHEINRGGDITYHGPGQVVVYPIINLRSRQIKVREYLGCLEEAGIQFLKQKGIEAGRKPPYTGIWVHNKKIASLGIGIKEGISVHGMAFNINTDMKFFEWIVPCGIQGVQMTSLAEVRGDLQNMGQSKQELADCCAQEIEAIS